MIDVLKEKLLIYEETLKKWQKTINLVAPSTINHIWKRHFSDSLQLAQYIGNNNRILDIGSGAGFPGLILAMTGLFDVTCIDSDTRKTIFLSEVARQTDTRITVINSRIENLLQDDFDIITARGFAKLVDMIPFVIKYTKTGQALFLKGKNYQNEIAETEKIFNLQYEIYDSAVDSFGKIIKITMASKK